MHHFFTRLFVIETRSKQNVRAPIAVTSAVHEVGSDSYVSDDLIQFYAAWIVIVTHVFSKLQ